MSQTFIALAPEQGVPTRGARRAAQRREDAGGSGSLPGFPEEAWRGPFAHYRRAMADATEAPECSHFAALWTHAAVRLRRRVWIPYPQPLRPNVYLVIVGPTG